MRIEIKKVEKKKLTDTESAMLGVISDDPDINGCIEVHYDHPMFLPGHTHIIPELAIWHRMHARDITAAEAIESFILETIREESVDLIGRDKAAKAVLPMPEKVREFFSKEKEGMVRDAATRAGLIVPGGKK